jgi:2-dehydropantoate 2-reductase
VKLAIVGAGATGGFLGARLARACEDVVLIARGAHLQAMRDHGLTVREADGEYTTRPRVSDDLEEVHDADAVFLTLKAHALTDIAPRLARAMKPEAAVVTAQNGIPWWYFERYQGPLAGTRLESVDPDGAIARCIEAGRIVGCVVYPATRLAGPGVVEHIEGARFTIGELDGSRSERCAEISGAIRRAGLKCPVTTRIRHELWLKLLGNVAFNPVSALTGATLSQIGADEQALGLVRAVMEEADAVARALGVELEIGVEQRLRGAIEVGEHKTSMRQDVEAGRPLEVDALLGSVVELGGLLDVPVPHLATLYACVRLLDRTRGR